MDFPEGLFGIRPGICYMIVSAVLYAFASFSAAVASRLGGQAFGIVFVRSCWQWLFALLFFLIFESHKGTQFFGPEPMRKWLCLRGICGIGGLIGYYYCITKIPLGDATVIIFTSPIWTLIVAYYALGESFGTTEAICVMMSLAGITCISKPTFLFGRVGALEAQPMYHLAVFIGLCGAVTAGCALVTIRMIGNRVNFITFVNYVGMCGILLAPVLAVATGTPILPPFETFWPMLACGILGFGAQCAMSRGLQLEPAGRASLIRNLDVVISFGFQVMFFNEEASRLSVVGALLILSTSVILTFSSRKATVKPNTCAIPAVVVVSKT